MADQHTRSRDGETPHQEMENGKRRERSEPDEPGEGMLTRANATGGFEPRILQDQDDPPLADQIAHSTDHEGGVLRHTPPA